MCYLYSCISGVPKLYPRYFCTLFFIIKGVIFSMSASAIRLLLSSRIFFFCSCAHSTALSWSSGRSLMEKHLPRFLENGTTAIICSQDTLANAALIQCQQLGYQVPDDVSIIEFDDLPIAAYTSPPLTTIRQDRIELGKSGFFALSSLLNGVSISTFLLHTQLIERKSTGNVPVA